MTARRRRQVLRQGYNPYGEADYERYGTPLEVRRATARRAVKSLGPKVAKEALEALGWSPNEITEAMRKKRRTSLGRARRARAKRRITHRRTR